MTNFNILKRLWKDYTKEFTGKIAISVFYTIIVAASTSSIAWLLDPAIKKLFVEKNQSLILIIPGLIILAFALKGISLYLARVTMIGVAEDVKAIIQSDMSEALVKADTRYIDDKHSGKFISNLTFDVGLMTNLVSTVILNFFKDSLTLIGLLTVMFYQNWKLALIAITMIPLASFAAKSLGKRIGKISTEAQVEAGVLTSHLIEVFKNHKIIKIFQQEDQENLRVIGFINSLKEKSKKISIIFVRATPIMETLTGIMIAILIYFSAKLILNDELEVNNFFSFLAAMMLAYQPVRSLATLNMAINQGLSSAKRVLPIIDIKNEISENEDSIDLNIKNANIKFENVSFQYKKNDKEVLKSINIEILGGKMNALVGHSGAGKSTILNLIPRFFNCTKGDIFIDEQSIYSAKINSLRKNISLVSQDVILFDDTVKANIAYADPKASQNEIIEACRFAAADEFINKLSDGYETLIGESGVRLSGGQKQRLSIARAILKKSPIILLDEATSSLDAESEEVVQNAIANLTKNKTTLVIAHRLSTIYSADKIFFLKGGSVLDSGNHDSLMNSSDEYRSLVEKQLK